MKKLALYYEKLENEVVQCKICPRMCKIYPNKIGNCGTRKNEGGKLYSLIYGSLSSIAIDPIEKKPLYNFYPGSNAFSISSVGCSLHCKHCQNFSISQTNVENTKRFLKEKTPDNVVEMAASNNCTSIAYTYNEPLIWFEFILDTIKLAKKAKIKNILVTNGYINLDPLEELINAGVDAANVDIKAFTDEFYQKVCLTPKGGLTRVLDATEYMHKKGVFVECTNLIIPGYNDNLDEIKNLAKWIRNSMDFDVPLHFSAYRPMYKLNAPHTPYETIINACKIAYEEIGLHYVYAGNVSTDEYENTYCPKCKKIIIKRVGYSLNLNNLTQKNTCSNCGTKINIEGNIKTGRREFSFF